MNREFKKVKVKDILFDPANPNKMSDEQLSSLRYSLKKFGQLKPPIIDQTMTVCDGEHQVRAYLAEGIEDIDVFQVDCTPAQRRLIRQTMNKLHGSHDVMLDMEELKALNDSGDLSELSLLLAQSEDELRLIMNGLEDDCHNGPESFDAESALRKPPKYDVKLGDVWQLGKHRLMCGDCTKEENVSVLMGGGES